MNPDYPNVLRRMAEACQTGNAAMWDFGAEYSTVREAPDFSYADAARAAKENWGVELISSHIATRMAKAYEAFHKNARVPLDELKQYSPYTCYDVTRYVDLRPDNVGKYLQMIGSMTRNELINTLAGQPDKPELKTITIDASVAEMLEQARQLLAQAAGETELTNTVFIEVMSMLVLESQQTELRAIWRRLHGDDEG